MSDKLIQVNWEHSPSTLYILIDNGYWYTELQSGKLSGPYPYSVFREGSDL